MSFLLADEELSPLRAFSVNDSALAAGIINNRVQGATFWSVVVDYAVFTIVKDAASLDVF